MPTENVQLPRMKRGTSVSSGDVLSLGLAGTSQPNTPVVYLSGKDATRMSEWVHVICVLDASGAEGYT